MGLIPSRLNMYIYIWLVGWTPLKIWKSVGMMIIPNIWKVIKLMFQTIYHIYIYIRSYHQHILSRSHISSPALGTSPRIDQSCPISSQLGLTLLKVISLLTSSQGPVRRKRGKIEKTFYKKMARNTSCKY
jgi:hypothetical protein